MPDIHIPTVNEIYMISFLTKYDWAYDSVLMKWKKDGKTMLIWKDDRERAIDCFDLETAYWEEVQAQDKI